MYNTHLTFAQFFKHKDLVPYLYLLSLKMSDGHICIPTDQLPELEDQNLFAQVAIKPFGAIEAPELIGNEHDLDKPFIHHQNRLYTQRYFKYETQVLQYIQQTIQLNATAIPNQISISKINTLFSQEPNETNWQAIAAINALLQSFAIITGGPGTGKTTTIAKLLHLLYFQNPDIRVAIAAPTGKASARMSESLQKAANSFDEPTQVFFKTLVPNTIHRLLGYIPKSIYYKHNNEQPLPYDVVIIDESSMVDIALFAKLLDAIAPTTKLILLGDKDQLASVEAGSTLGDICQAVNLNAFTPSHFQLLSNITPIHSDDEKITNQALSNHIVALQKSHRFSSTSGIGQFAKAIIHNDVYTLQQFLANHDAAIHIDSTTEQSYIEQFAQGYKAYIQEADIFTALQRFNDVKILCAVKDGPAGLHHANTIVEKYLAQQQLIQPNYTFYEHMPIMITQNDYNLGLYNGDIGIVRKDEKGILKVWFIDNEAERTVKAVLPGFINMYETVYAMTIHKSQGSEFDEVLILLPHTESKILTKELIYTGVTRAKQKVYIQTDRDTFLQACDTPVSRGSGLIERLKAL